LLVRVGVLDRAQVSLEQWLDFGRGEQLELRVLPYERTYPLLPHFHLVFFLRLLEERSAPALSVEGRTFLNKLLLFLVFLFKGYLIHMSDSHYLESKITEAVLGLVQLVSQRVPCALERDVTFISCLEVFFEVLGAGEDLPVFSGGRAFLDRFLEPLTFSLKRSHIRELCQAFYGQLIVVCVAKLVLIWLYWLTRSWWILRARYGITVNPLCLANLYIWVVFFQVYGLTVHSARGCF
jgi:hypothetical protein